jgi:ATP-dependent DNA helicase RecG
MYILSTSIEYLKGVGPKKSEVLKKELNIFNFHDLLYFFPFRYIDRSKFYKISEITSDLPNVQVIGQITKIETIGAKHAKRLVAKFSDNNKTIDLVWFKNTKWIKDNIKINTDYVVFGKPNLFNGKLNIVHPDLELVKTFNKEIIKRLQPIYHSTEKLNKIGLNNKTFTKLTQELIPKVFKEVEETLPQYLIEKLNLISKKEALKNIHFPIDSNTLLKAQYRLKFEELFYIQIKLVKMKLVRKMKLKGFTFSKVDNYFNRFFMEKLPFELTNAQKQVLKEIRKDCGANHQMNRLLQGDVGSGKTLVALMSMLIALDNDFQTCLMAPTEILANQHYDTIKELIDDLPIGIELLTGSVKTKKRKEIHKNLENGNTHILIGTHALLEDKVKYKNLGLVVIDEQHRFGVAQRAKMWKKNTKPPHILVMTATPIPRTLGMTMYGDLDISVIDELPPGRKSVKTFWKSESGRLATNGIITTEINKGRQVYIVYPLIKESEKLDYSNLMEGYENICRTFPNQNISIVHGQMKAEDKDFEMNRFLKKETQIMVATTVIEVGVNVPNASVMVIESSERFGLSQLHQLRGRVGRGAEQSYCILMSGNKISAEGQERLKTMVRTNDGFDIAEVDLKLRGPGNMMGTKQSGVIDLKIADIVRDNAILQYARQIAIDILNDDPKLEKNKNKAILKEYNLKGNHELEWSRIS